MPRHAVISSSLALSLALFAADSFAQQNSNNFRGSSLLYATQPPIAVARAASSDTYGDMLSAAISARSAAIAAAQSPSDGSRTISGSLLDARVGAASQNFLSANTGVTIGQYTGRTSSPTHTGSLLDAQAAAASPSLVNATTGATVGQHTGPHSSDPYGAMLSAATGRADASFTGGPTGPGSASPGSTNSGDAGLGAGLGLSGLGIGSGLGLSGLGLGVGIGGPGGPGGTGGGNDSR